MWQFKGEIEFGSSTDTVPIEYFYRECMAVVCSGTINKCHSVCSQFLLYL